MEEMGFVRRNFRDDIGQVLFERYTSVYSGDSLETLGKRNLLLIENDVESRDSLTEIMDDDYNMILADNGLEGLEVMSAGKQKISVILVDLEDSTKGGFDFIRKLRKLPKFKDIPVLVIKDNLFPGDEMACLKLGVIDFISRPFIPGLLRSRVSNIVHLRESAATLSAVEYDELTGLYTKSAFLHYAEMRLQSDSSTEYAIIGIDIENYKLTNSLYGEEKCDEFLAYIGRSLAEISPKGLKGRFGGDQFVIMVPTRVEAFPEFLQEQVEKYLKKAPIPHQNCKIGVYASVDRKISIVSACDRAFWAIKKIKGMYQKNIAFYSEEIMEQLLTEQKIQECMEEALEQGQFKVYYQPKHDCLTGRVAGAEALVRWEHPLYGFMSPGEFIPLFERNGFVTKLDFFVLQQVCEDLKRWKEAGLSPVPISTNVSRRDFFENGWIRQHLAIVDRYGIDPKLLHMEVTESLYVENREQIIEQVRKAQKYGCLIEMDDFGSGYSSLGTLTDFPLDVIKLDISFVRNISKNEIVIDTIIKLAHRMGFKTVAEGVETRLQYQKLCEMGCDFIQGFYFSRPLPAAQFERYFTSDREKKKTMPGNSQKVPQWNELTKELEVKNTLLECVDVLSGNGDADKKLESLLAIVTRFYGGDRSYILHFAKSGEPFHAYEWCNNGIASEIDSIFERKVRFTKNRGDFGRLTSVTFISDLELIKEENPVAYELFKSKGIQSYLAAPLYLDGKNVGVVGIDNPRVHTDSLDLMSSIPSFITNELSRDNYIKTLVEIGYKDTLTGLLNRRAFDRDVKELEENAKTRGESLGIASADINGLKMKNVAEGNQAGDAMILSVAKDLSEIFRTARIYRLSGDEFVVIDSGVTKKKMEENTAKLKERWSQTGIASLGSVWLPDVQSVESVVEAAEQEMLRDKGLFYLERTKDEGESFVIDGRTLQGVERMADSLPGGFMVCKANQSGDLIFYNHEVLKLFGCEDEAQMKELSGNSFWNLVAGEDLEQTRKVITAQYLANEKNGYVEYHTRDRNGREVRIRQYERFVHSAYYGNVAYVFLSVV